MQKSATVQVYTEGLTLSPDLEAGVKTCPLSTLCVRVCIGSETGRYKNPGMDRYRIKRTLYWWLFPEDFTHKIRSEFHLVRGRAMTEDMEPAVRLNVASDIRWEYVPEVMDAGMPLYDYTALPRRLRRDCPPHYHLLYSLKEHKGSLANALDWLEHGGNVAVVIGGPLHPDGVRELALLREALRVERSPARIKILEHRRAHVQSKYGMTLGRSKQAALAVLQRGKLWGFDTIPGDVHDARMLDAPTDPLLAEARGAWIVLHAKGPAVQDPSPFIVRVDPGTGFPLAATLEARAAQEISWDELERQKLAHRTLLSPPMRMEPLEPPVTLPTPRGQRDIGHPREICVQLPSPWLVNPDGSAIREWRWL